MIPEKEILYQSSGLEIDAGEQTINIEITEELLKQLGFFPTSNKNSWILHTDSDYFNSWLIYKIEDGWIFIASHIAYSVKVKTLCELLQAVHLDGVEFGKQKKIKEIKHILGNE